MPRQLFPYPGGEARKKSAEIKLLKVGPAFAPWLSQLEANLTLVDQATFSVVRTPAAAQPPGVGPSTDIDAMFGALLQSMSEQMMAVDPAYASTPATAQASAGLPVTNFAAAAMLQSTPDAAKPANTDSPANNTAAQPQATHQNAASAMFAWAAPKAPASAANPTVKAEQTPAPEAATDTPSTDTSTISATELMALWQMAPQSVAAPAAKANPPAPQTADNSGANPQSEDSIPATQAGANDTRSAQHRPTMPSQPDIKAAANEAQPDQAQDADGEITPSAKPTDSATPVQTAAASSAAAPIQPAAAAMTTTATTTTPTAPIQASAAPASHKTASKASGTASDTTAPAALPDEQPVVAPPAAKTAAADQASDATKQAAADASLPADTNNSDVSNPTVQATTAPAGPPQPAAVTLPPTPAQTAARTSPEQTARDGAVTAAATQTLKTPQAATSTEQPTKTANKSAAPKAQADKPASPAVQADATDAANTIKTGDAADPVGSAPRQADVANTDTQPAAQQAQTAAPQFELPQHHTAKAETVAAPAAPQADLNLAAPRHTVELQLASQHHTADTATGFDKLGVTIAAKTLEGLHEFDIRLDPPDLGRIQVKLTVDDRGQAQATLVADKQQTLDLLQRDASSLNRTLNDAGLNLANNGLNFSLREQQQNESPMGRGRSRSLGVKAVIAGDPSSIRAPSGSYAPNSARLDIRV